MLSGEYDCSVARASGARRVCGAHQVQADRSCNPNTDIDTLISGLEERRPLGTQPADKHPDPPTDTSRPASTLAER